MSSSGVILRALHFDESSRPPFQDLGSGIKSFRWACMSLLSGVEKNTCVQLTGPIKIYHDQRASLYNQGFVKKPGERGGREPNDGDNTVH